MEFLFKLNKIFAYTQYKYWIEKKLQKHKRIFILASNMFWNNSLSRSSKVRSISKFSNKYLHLNVYFLAFQSKLEEKSIHKLIFDFFLSFLFFSPNYMSLTWINTQSIFVYCKKYSHYERIRSDPKDNQSADNFFMIFTGFFFRGIEL